VRFSTEDKETMAAEKLARKKTSARLSKVTTDKTKSLSHYRTPAQVQSQGPVDHVEKPNIETIFQEHVSYFNILLIYLCYITMLSCGYLNQWVENVRVSLGYQVSPLGNRKGHAPLFHYLDIFWLRRSYQRLRDLFERPISSVPGPWVDVMIRESDDGNATFRFTGETRTCLNLCSYNYLGFAENSGPIIDTVEDSIRKYGVTSGTTRSEGGNHSLIEELEELVCELVGKPAAMIVGMGYATNSTVLPLLADSSADLIISDSLNHASIVCGARDSRAKILVFKHNDAKDLDNVLRKAISGGQPRTHVPWKKVIVVVEGVYSMEGEIVKLPEILKVTKRHKAYLYVDEAHSIGAVGRTGKGVCEHWGIDPAEIDILMGTFTKAFGSVGGYICANEQVVTYLKSASYGSVYSVAMTPPCAQQAISAFRVILSKDGTTSGRDRLESLHFNSNYFRMRLTEMGFHIIGDDDSPVVPLMVYHVGKMTFLSRELLKRGITIVVVGYPVTTLMMSRIRFCISAAHTKDDLDWALGHIEELGKRCLLDYGLSSQ